MFEALTTAPIKATITREQLLGAIDSGFGTAVGMTERDRDRVRQVAVSTPVVGSNFDEGCPLTLAFGPDRRRFSNFTFGYDDAMLRLIQRDAEGRWISGPYCSGHFLIRIVD